MCLRVCYHLKNLPVLFFPPEPRQQAVFVSLSASGLLELRPRTHLWTCVLVCLFKCASPSIYVHTRVSLYVMRCILPSPVAPFAALSAHPPWPHAAICFLRLFIQRLLSQPIIVFRDPWPPTLHSLCLLHAKRVKTKWPKLFVYFPSYCKWSHTYALRGCPPYSTLPVCMLGKLYNGQTQIRLHKWSLRRNC